MWHPTNPNPCGVYVGDCVIRALAIALNKKWDSVYVDLCVLGFLECDMPNANHVWGKYLEQHGFSSRMLSPANNVTVQSFCDAHPHGLYVLTTGAHVVTVIDGEYYDAWDSGNERPIYIWEEK